MDWTQTWAGAVLELGDGDDRLNVQADIQTGIDDGEGNDELLGGPGADFFDAGPGRDIYDGREGIDHLQYHLRGIRVKIKVDGRANDGGAVDGYRDDPRSIENYDGGFGDDLINARRSLIGVTVGGGPGGNDRIIGSRYADHIWAGSGHDYINAGDGDDQLDVHESSDERDFVICGRGWDHVEGSGSLDVLNSCESTFG